MSVDAVLHPLAVYPRQDTRDQRRRDKHHEDEHHPTTDDDREDSQPLRNALGQVIGKTINITV